MLRAVVEDFAEVAEVVVLAAPWFDTSLPAEVVRSSDATAYRRLASSADGTLAIAPEFDGILERLCGATREAGGRWLGCSAESIRLAADKLALAEWWRGRGVPTPQTALLRSNASCRFPAVLKPRFGAGSQATLRIDGAERWDAAVRTFLAEAGDDEGLVQDYAPGMPASVAFLCGPGGSAAMLPTEQRLSADGRFRYLGGRVPLPPPLSERAIALATRAIEGIAGLNGWVGVDLVLGENSDDDRAVEINPRLTTSYIGLRRLVRGSLADAWLMADRGETPKFAWTNAGLTFDA